MNRVSKTTNELLWSIQHALTVIAVLLLIITWLVAAIMLEIS